MTNINKEKLEGLKALLSSHKHIKVVYFNEDGDWLFVPRPGFENEVDRKEILSTEIEEATEEKTNSGKGSEKTPRMKAADLITLIGAAATTEDVDALIVDEDRKTVLDAAEAKKKSFVTE